MEKKMMLFLIGVIILLGIGFLIEGNCNPEYRVTIEKDYIIIKGMGNSVTDTITYKDANKISLADYFIK